MIMWRGDCCGPAAGGTDAHGATPASVVTGHRPATITGGADQWTVPEPFRC